MKIDVERVAELANLPLTDEEMKTFQPQLEAIVAFVEKLNEVDTTGVPPTYQVTGKINELREDVPQKPLTISETTRNAPKTQNGFILTKGVLADA